MEWYIAELIIIGKILLAFILGSLIGLEREYHKSPAGLRTYAAIALGACCFGLLSTHCKGTAFYTSVVDPSRIAAQIVSGIGFIGAGVIFKSGSTTRGLTTAATIWVTASIGLAVAFGLFSGAVLTTFLVIFILVLNYIPFWANFKRKYFLTDVEKEMTSNASSKKE